MIIISKLAFVFSMIRKFFIWCLGAVLRPYNGRRVTISVRTVKDVTTTDINRLPDELLLHVFSHLQPAERSVVCMSVCRRWRRVARDESLWREIKFNIYFSTEHLQAYLQLPFIRNVTTLQLTKHHGIPNVSLPNLEILVIVLHRNFLKDLVRDHDKIARRLIDNFPSLRFLKVFRSSHFPLVFNYTVSMSEFFEKLKSFNPKLRLTVASLTLQVNNPEQFIPKFKILNKVCSVQSVKFELGYIEDPTDLQELASLLPRITAFAGCFSDACHFFSNILTDLAITSSYFGVTKADTFKIIPRTCTNLQIYRLSIHLSGKLPFLIAPLVNLMELEMCDCYGLTDREILQVLARWRKLTVLSVRFKKCSKRHLGSIAEVNPNLMKLFLYSDKPSRELKGADIDAVNTNLNLGYDHVDDYVFYTTDNGSSDDDDDDSDDDSTDNTNDDDSDDDATDNINDDDSDEEEQEDDNGITQSEYQTRYPGENVEFSLLYLEKLVVDRNITELLSTSVELHVPSCTSLHFTRNRDRNNVGIMWVGLFPCAPTWKPHLLPSFRYRHGRQYLLEKLKQTVKSVHLSEELVSYDELLFWVRTCPELTKVKFQIHEMHENLQVTTEFGKAMKLCDALLDTLKPLQHLEKCVMEDNTSHNACKLVRVSRVFPRCVLRTLDVLGLKSSSVTSKRLYCARGDSSA